jgi:LmbE family N-acetylglucosaminyl deacetylase
MLADRPMPLLSARTRLLVVAPHPDDETLAAGVLMQQVMAAGGQVHVLLLTDGDNNPWPQRYLERRWRIDAGARARWGRRRRGEVGLALDRLGVPAGALLPMAWPDMGLLARLCDETESTLDAVAAVIRTLAPDLVAVPALGDRHPDHGAAHVLCQLALARSGREPVQLAYPVHGGGRDGQSVSMAPALPGQQQRKRAALSGYTTQLALSGGRMRALGERAESFMAVESGLAAKPGFLPWRPAAALQPFLRLLVAGAEGVVDRPWRAWPLKRADGGFRLESASPGPRFARLHLDWPSPWIFDHWGWCRL